MVRKVDYVALIRQATVAHPDHDGVIRNSQVLFALYNTPAIAAEKPEDAIVQEMARGM